MTGLLRPTAMRLLIAIVAMLVLGGGVRTASAQALKVGDRLAEMDIAVDEAGKPFKLKAFKGKWVLITVGAEWCVPCAKELPAWDKIAGEWKSKITFVAINIDDDIEDGKHFNKRLKLANLITVYAPAVKSAAVAKYGSDNMPTTFIADPQGVVRYVRAGFEKRDVSGEIKKLKAQLAKLVK
jgi:thiol-disulfide isomerase/thioredoxin